MLFVRHINFGPRPHRGTELPHVAHHADDGHGLQRVEAAVNHVADRILVRKRLLGQRFIDECAERRVERVAIAEVPAAELRNTQGAEISGRDHRHHRLRPADA